MTPAARLDRVTVVHETPQGPVTALNEVSLRFERGHSTAIMGRSGSGKSTLMSVMALLRRPTSGDVWIDDEPASALGEIRRSGLRSRGVGVVFQSFHLEQSMDALDNVALSHVFARVHMSRAQSRRRSQELLDMLGVGELGRRRPAEMSGGQRQRIAIARALFAAPSLLIADEPTGNLDEETAGGVAELLYSSADEAGAAVVVVTHDQDVARLAQRVVRLERGRVVEAPQ